MRTVQCPSCGASAQNHKNCEYCGSLFVRAYDLEYDLNGFSIDSIRNTSFSGLKEELDYNLSLRDKFNCDYFHTEIYPSKLDWLNSTSDDGILRVHNLDNGSSANLNKYLTIEILKKSLSDYQILKFSNLNEFRFFEFTDDSDGGFWTINFGSDTVGASFLISKLLIEVYDFKSTAPIYFSTIVENIVIDSPDDNRWWAEEASEEFKDRYNRAAIKLGGYTRNEDGSYNKPDSINEEKKGNCFIATATMGDYDNPIVMDLRYFRDNWILKKNWGKDFVSFYYKYGRYPANFIAKKNWRKKISYYLIVRPLHMISKICK